jgi:hypothetical protein
MTAIITQRQASSAEQLLWTGLPALRHCGARF